MKYLNVYHVAARFDVSRATIWRWVRERHDFPQPVKLTQGSTRWRLADLEAWEKQREGESA